MDVTDAGRIDHSIKKELNSNGCSAEMEMKHKEVDSCTIKEETFVDKIKQELGVTHTSIKNEPLTDECAFNLLYQYHDQSVYNGEMTDVEPIPLETNSYTFKEELSVNENVKNELNISHTITQYPLKTENISDESTLDMNATSESTTDSDHNDATAVACYETENCSRNGCSAEMEMKHKEVDRCTIKEETFVDKIKQELGVTRTSIKNEPLTDECAFNLLYQYHDQSVYNGEMTDVEPIPLETNSYTFKEELSVNENVKNELNISHTITQYPLKTENISDESTLDMNATSESTTDSDHNDATAVACYETENCSRYCNNTDLIEVEMGSHFRKYGNEPCQFRLCQTKTKSNCKPELARYHHTHTEDKPFLCKQRIKYCNQTRTLPRHLHRHKGERSFKCDQCEKAFLWKSSLARHLLIHKGEKPLKCDQCEKAFHWKCDLTQHLLIHKGEKPFKCDQCEKAFLRKGHLTRHLIYKGEKPLKCDQCEEEFLWKCDLTRHLLIYKGEKPFKCDQCEKAFLRKSDLTQHLLIHKGEKPFKCDQCEKAFLRKGHLTRHLLIHKGEKPFKCDQCEKAFLLKEDLTRHLLTHKGEKPFKRN